MDIKYFNLIDGSLEFHNNKILIFDKADRNRISILILTLSGLLYSIITTIKGFRRQDNEGLWFGLLLTMLWILISVFRRKEFQKVENEIFLSNINYVKFSIDKFYGSTIVKIISKNNRQRKIKITQEDNQDLEFKNLLINNKIEID